MGRHKRNVTYNNVFIVLLVYVDDIVITGNNIEEINNVKHSLSKTFMIKDLGKLKYFLGIEVIETEHGLSLCQRKYFLELLNEFGLLGCKPLNTSIEVNVSSYNGNEKDKVLSNITVQFMHAPITAHLKLAFRVLRYLKGSPGKGVHISKGMSLNLVAYSDSDWAKNLIGRKSITGYCVFMGNSLISWKSKKQPTVSMSSAEAEYRALAAITCEIIWILKVLNDLKLMSVLPITLCCDNSPVIQIAANPVHHERTKHFDIDWHIVREKVNSGLIKILKIDSEVNPADLFTKDKSMIWIKGENSWIEVKE
ncbi:uncharacterized mitochondrial protein AtMg00810-like [Rutidosis leptorrhynchoides]|uniref:uncharacterized mitochondrial protein AtMg00810-like n=1 Tax=Rutidosis leptorrhynchoides TaxID=125765 RepID=UPI003A99D4E0